MKRVCTALAMAAALLMTTSANADTFTIDANVDSIDSGLVFESTFDLGDVESIKSISVDLAHTWGGDIEMTLTNVASGDVYELMFDDVDVSGSGNFDMGVVAGDASLGNVDTYTFVAPGGGMADWADDFAPGGTYDANIWGGGGSGDWVFTLNDDAAGDPTSVGSIVIDFNPSTVIPEPTTFAVLVGMAGVAAVRRRR